MIYSKFQLTFTIYMVMADEAIHVNISLDKTEAPIGDSVTYTCTWSLDDEYGQLV